MVYSIFSRGFYVSFRGFAHKQHKHDTGYCQQDLISGYPPQNNSRPGGESID